MKTTVFFTVALASLATSLSAQTPPAKEAVIGRIGDLQVNATDVRASVASLSTQDETAVRRDPALLNQVVRSLLVQRALLREAEAKGHDRKPAVAAQLARAREVALTESYLQSVSLPPESYPSEVELKAAYETARPSIGVPKSWRLAQIFVPVGKEADKATTDQAQTKLETVRRSLKAAGANFAKIASDYSEEQSSARRGGEIGWLGETQIQPQIREKLGSLKVDAISEPIRLDDGWHIVKVLDSREPYTPTLDQVRSQLAAQLRAEKTKANSQAFLARLLQDNPLAINELALSQVIGDGKE